jgi:hypothetical protein
MMKLVNPENIDGVISELQKMKADLKPQRGDYVMRLSIETNLAALSDRREQYIACGVLANAGGEGPPP